MELKGHIQADIGSALSTSGGLYWWTHFFSSPATRNPLNPLVGYGSSIGLIGGFAVSTVCASKFFFREVP